MIGITDFGGVYMLMVALVLVLEVLVVILVVFLLLSILLIFMLKLNEVLIYTLSGADER